MKKNNKIKNCIVYLFLINLMMACSNKQIESKLIDEIYFDSNLSLNNFDLKNLIDSTVAIIPLETSENSLISSIDKIEISGNKIFIQDRLAQAIYIYDMQGNYLNKLNKRGQGPGEYVDLSSMTVTDSNIIVIDRFLGKQIEYSRDSLNYIFENHIFNEIWCTEVFTLPDHIYYINDWSDSNSGKFRLFSMKNNSNEFNRYLPFENEPVALGIENYVYGVSGNKASVIYSGSDYIYRVQNEKIFPEYKMIFENEKVKYHAGKVENVFKDNQTEGLVLGISSINESDKYLFIDITVIGNKEYTCIYDKEDKTTIIYDRIAINSWLDNEQLIVRRIIDNKIIDWRDATMLFLHKKYLYADKEFQNQKFKDQLDLLFNNLEEESNPVLFIYNLK